MDASTRLYKRLGEIPEDPNDPESLDDLIVCAFGAFERYYVCWRTKGGEYKQNGYDLPPALRDWLYPTDGTARDFASLQVVFGRGEEYFASDKHGKLEYKEPEVKKPTPTEDEEKLDRQALRRSRTVSFLRPLSETSVRSENATIESNKSKRSSSISSQQPSWPPSLSYTNSRTNSEISIPADTIVEGKTSLPTRPSTTSQWTAFGARIGNADLPPLPHKPTTDAMLAESEPVPTVQSPIRTRTARNIGESLAADLASLPPRSKAASSTSTCTCGCHNPPSPPQSQFTYTSAFTQTDRLPSPPRTGLRIDTSTPSYWPSQHGYSAVSQDACYSHPQQDYDTPPVFMGRMMNYFSNPGYQLGDSLISGYQPINWQHTTHEYQDEFGKDALW